RARRPDGDEQLLVDRRLAQQVPVRLRMGPADRAGRAHDRRQEPQLPWNFGELLAQPGAGRQRHDLRGAGYALLRQGRAVAADPGRTCLTCLRVHRRRRVRWRQLMALSTMESYFNELAALLDRALLPGEVYSCTLEAEVSDFVRMNRGKIRQPGTVEQRYVRLHLIAGRKHAQHCMSVCGDLARNREPLLQALVALRGTVTDLPDDPHLHYATDVHSSRVVRSTPLPAPDGIIATVLDAAHGLDLVGIYAAGPVYRGFANSLGQRNWHEVTSFNLQWSLYHRADKAVKTAYGGFEWSDQAFAAKMRSARERLALLAVPARSLEPGSYRAYLTPAAMEEIASMLCWGGFSGRALATRQSCLFRMQEGAAALDASVSFSENTAGGVAPAFQDEGFARPASVPLVTNGKLVGSLVSPRTAKEFELATNGANASESPESLEM